MLLLQSDLLILLKEEKFTGYKGSNEQKYSAWDSSSYNKLLSSVSACNLLRECELENEL
jgi:hypothetical protein